MIVYFVNVRRRCEGDERIYGLFERRRVSRAHHSGFAIPRSVWRLARSGS
jgi:hypothetical protein